jgi:ATP-dependent exoDNAse (exonuclease V) alpha subunit
VGRSQKHFIHSYCRTCHSFQGSSINRTITVFDWRFFFVNRKWIYTAVTRAMELNGVFFFGLKD